jgi:hypothetical protein
MREITVLLEGGQTLKNLNEDLAKVMEHSYNTDELFMMYVDWCRRGDTFIDDFVKLIYPEYVAPDQEDPEEAAVDRAALVALYESYAEEAADNRVALRNAMINLYRALDIMTPHLDRRRVIHAACNQDDGVIMMLVR